MSYILVHTLNHVCTKPYFLTFLEKNYSGILWD